MQTKQIALLASLALTLMLLLMVIARPQLSVETVEFTPMAKSDDISRPSEASLITQPVVKNNSLMPTERNCTNVGFSPHPLPKTALASYPGSGNTWSRHLIELSTGIYSGAIYRDTKLLPHLKGEGQINHSVVVVKTHWPWYKGVADKFGYNKVVLLIRHPLDAMKAEYKREHSRSSHVMDVVSIKPSEWQKFVAEESVKHAEFHKFWFEMVEREKQDFFLLFYDDMLDYLSSTVLKLSSFLGFAVPQDTLRCVVENSEGKYHRKHVTTERDPFEEIAVNHSALESCHNALSARIKECLNEGWCSTSGRTSI